MKPVIAITMGDPAGVGPEICLAALASPAVHRICQPIVFGHWDILCKAAERLQRRFEAERLSIGELTVPPLSKSASFVVHVDGLNLETFRPGHVSGETGRASFNMINSAIDAALAGRVHAVATAPINKEALSLANIQYPGHTEIFADRSGSNRWCMMQYSEEITCTFVTVHIGYADVPRYLTTDRILDVIQLSHDGLLTIRNREPKITVLGLNPHAGEHGLFGNREEERIILPAIEKARSLGLNVEGPLPPDTAFLPWKRKSTDVFVCMYHDQGHIPVKALAFDNAVNTTLGLSIIRTSVDHGTALDIAWQGKANPNSLFKAIELAALLARTS